MKVFNALRIFPLVLLAVAAMSSFSQDRYNFGSHWYMSGWDYYDCASQKVIYGNNRVTALNAAREDAIETANNNMAALDNYEPLDIHVPVRNVYLQLVIDWIEEVEIINMAIVQKFGNYDRSRIMGNINSHFDALLAHEDASMQRGTEQCAREQNFINRNNDEPDSYTYNVGYTGRNLWLVYPIRTAKPKVTVLGPLEDCDGDQCEDGG